MSLKIITEPGHDPVKDNEYLTLYTSPFYNCQISSMGGIEAMIEDLDQEKFDDLMNEVFESSSKMLLLDIAQKEYEDDYQDEDACYLPFLQNKYNVLNVFEYLSTNGSLRYLVLIKNPLK